MNWFSKWVRKPEARTLPHADVRVDSPESSRTPAPDSQGAPAATNPSAIVVPAGRSPGDTTEASLEAEIRATLVRADHQLERAFPETRSADGTGLLRKSVLTLDPQMIRRPPPAAQAGLDAADDPSTPISTLVTYFERDPSLAQDLMRQANSIHYSSGGVPARSLRDAVQRIGSGGVHGVLLAATVRGMLCRPGSEYQGMVDRVWAHLVRTGPLARGLARRFGADPEEAFLVGLFHDVGKLVVFDRLATMRAERRAPIRLAPAFLSRLLRITHAPLGAAIALRWKLGLPIASAILTHHREDPENLGGPLSVTACVAERADLLVAAGLPVDAERLWERAALPGVAADFETIVDLARGLGETGEDESTRRAA